MPGRHHPLFSAEDLAAIRAATSEAEGLTAGEVVPYSVDRCDDYADAVWRAATLGALGATLVVGLVHWRLDAWGVGVTWLLATPFMGAALGFLAAQPARIRRLLVAGAELERKTRLRAEAAFLEEEVFATRERTGILIVMALFERRVVILGDAGINAQVAPGEWEAIAARLAAGIREGRPAAALVEAIQACGKILEERRVAWRPDDRNELADGLRIRAQ